MVGHDILPLSFLCPCVLYVNGVQVYWFYRVLIVSVCHCICIVGDDLWCRFCIQSLFHSWYQYNWIFLLWGLLDGLVLCYHPRKW